MPEESSTREGPPPEDDVQSEARSLVASARALLQELSEEDVSQFDRLELPPLPSPAVLPVAPRSEDVSTAPSARAGSPPASPRSTPPLDPAPRERNDSSFVQAPDSTTPWQDRRPDLDEVRNHLGECTRCALSDGRKTIVFGDGNPQADLMFIGEGPGEQEDRKGLPFVGRAGELLTQMIEKGIGIPRTDVYICNIVKCRPPQNRTPLPPEVSACRPFLDGQIAAIAPKVIVTLGKPAASLLLDREVAITRLRGTWQDYRGIPLMPTLHPAYVLRQYTPENRRAVWQDLKAAFERSQA